MLPGYIKAAVTTMKFFYAALIKADEKHFNP